METIPFGGISLFMVGLRPKVYKVAIDRCYSFEVFAEDDRSCWLSVNEALGGKYAAVIAVCEQQDEKDMGFTPEAMSKPLEALGYRVVDTVKVLRLFEAGEVLKDSEALEHSRRSGERLVKTIKLRQDVETKIKELKM